MISKLRTSIRYWGIVPSICFFMIILGQLLVIVGTIGEMLK